MHEPDQHVSPIKNWKQLVVVVVLAFVVPIVVIVILSRSTSRAAPKGASQDDNAVLARIKPVGDVQLAVASGPKGQAHRRAGLRPDLQDLPRRRARRARRRSATRPRGARSSRRD